MARKRTPYEELHLIPAIIAEGVLDQQYTGEELSVRLRSGASVAAIEKARVDMTFEQKKAFVELCDTRCRVAYEKKASWFELCVLKQDNSGRDQLYLWFSHWLSAFLAHRGTSGAFWCTGSEFEGRHTIYQYRGMLFFGKVTWASSPHYPEFAVALSLGGKTRYQACDGHDFFEIFNIPVEECGEKVPAGKPLLGKRKFHAWLEKNGYVEKRK